MKMSFISIYLPHRRNCAIPARLASMQAIARFKVPLADAAQFRIELEGVKEIFAEAAGFIDAQVGQNLDEPTLWLLSTTWRDVGSYRRALSTSRSKLEAIPILAKAIDEPGAYE